MSLTFAKTRNMVAYLTKFDACEGFNQLIDFLNGSYIKYALTVNPNIYVSCIKQFWNTVAIKQVNDVTRLQALVDKKKVVVTEAVIREVLRLDDAEGVDCLPNEEIFAELSMSAKRTSWNEFSSAMASVVICLSTGKGFSGVETPLFEGMLVGQVIEEGGDTEEHVQDVIDDDAAQGNDTVAYGEVPTVSQEPSIPSPTSPTPPPQPPQDILSTSQDDVVTLMDDKEEDKKEKEAKVVEDDQVQGRQAESQAKIYKIDMDHALKVLKVVTAVSETVTAASTIIFDVEPQVTAASTRRRKGVVIRDPEEESTTSSIIPADTKSKDKGKWIMVEEPKPLKKKQQVEMDEEYARKLHAELNKDIDWDVAIDHVKQKAKEDPAVQRYQVIKKKPQTEAQARKNMIMYLKNVAGFRLDYFKGMSYDDIRPIFEVKFNSNVDFLLKTKEQMEEEESRALQSINETLAQKAAKRRKLNEEVEDLKRHLEIMPDEDDDVYTKATPLARKVPVVDYEIINLNTKPYYKIIRADGTHQLFTSFLTLLKNFDREDLEALWNLVKEKFSTSKPKNFSDDFLLTTLEAMLEKPDPQAQVWKNQRSIHVKRRYPLSRFTLDQMLNAMRLQVEVESAMSLELLRFTRQQHQEGQLE
nr:xylulose kinase-1 [Tanacetum cinerariifolium]